MRALCLAGFFITLIALAILVLLLQPAIGWPFNKIWILKTFSELQQYYSTINSISKPIAAMAALGLGFLYYRHRLLYEEKNARKDRIRRRIDFLIQELDQYDSHIDAILTSSITSVKELTSTRRLIDKSFENISLLIDQNETLLCFEDKTIRCLTSLFAFVDKNELIMHGLFTKLSRTEMKKIRPHYRSLFQKAKFECLLKSE